MVSGNSVAVIGAGAWGTALAAAAARAGRDVTLYDRNAEAVALMTSARSNSRLPGVRVDERISITGDIAVAAGFSDQAHFTRSFHARMALTPGAFRSALGN